MRYETPLLKRLLTKLIHDVLPAALASLIGGFLFTHFQLGRWPEPVAAQVTPASDEMMQLLRDEHGLIVNFLQARLANEKKQLIADEGASRGTGEPQQATVGSRPSIVTLAAVKANPARSKSVGPSVTAPPLLIAQLQQGESSKSVVRGEDIASCQNHRHQGSRGCRNPSSSSRRLAASRPGSARSATGSAART